MKREYRLIATSDAKSLGDQVTIYLESGWELYGPPGSTSVQEGHYSHNTEYFQAVIINHADDKVGV